MLHLGGDIVISKADIIGIFDLEKGQDSPTNKEFLDIAKDEGFIRKISDDPAKTYILTEVDKKTIVYLSPISSSTLLKRSDEFMDELIKNNIFTNSLK